MTNHATAIDATENSAHNDQTGPGQTGNRQSGDSDQARNRAHSETAMQRYLCHLGVEPTQGAELMRRVRLTGQLYDGIMAAKMRQGQLSPPRLRLLLCLFAHEAEGQPCLNPTRLSKELALSKNTISAHLRGLEELGLVERDVDPQDLRQFQIRLADAGRDWIRHSAPDHMRYLDELAAGLASDEIAQLMQLLGKLIDVLDMHGEANCRDSISQHVEARNRIAGKPRPGKSGPVNQDPVS